MRTSECCLRYKDIEYKFIVWWRVYSKIFPEIENLAKHKYISNLQRNNILQNKTKTKQSFHWLKID